MGLLSPKLEEKRLRLARVAKRQAFDCYMRRGQVPAALERLVEAAGSQAKFLDFGLSLFTKALGDDRPTTHYVWRSAGDERVRDTHAALSGQVFAWSDPPPHGHPGSEPNCRCWPEPYYGHPAVPDALLRLQRVVQSDSTGNALWSRIETLTRPDGSLAESTIQMRDGTRIYSAFSGASVTNAVTLANGWTVRFEKRDGVRRVYLGNDQIPLMEVSWAASGPQVALPRVRVAQVSLDTETEPPAPGPLILPSAGIIVAAGLLSLHNMLQAEPASLGATAAASPVIAFKVWKDGDDQAAGAVLVEALTAEQVSRWCKRLPEVQEWTNTAAIELAPLRAVSGASVWGTAVHAHVHNAVEALRISSPLAYGNVFSELSIDAEGRDSAMRIGPRYGHADTTRLDILEQVNPELVCVYDIKTGVAGLSMSRVRVIADRVRTRFPGANFYIMEVRPFE
ncbi:phage head morphogenesis protein, SPP1 gp7 family [Devosia sp. LC5]|uniref:phage minor head protein n=1 Tax=Devosia sp. LC5 TaxID=1502724 RepID=UPI0004E3F3A0|nr:phage minor head protein [Devosia sp. LC5]KFC69211.1 phage head morphogenesis protein, SPP1 gp7 family [Devosia sp. LC5]